jgi:hypothetical protein
MRIEPHPSEFRMASNMVSGVNPDDIKTVNAFPADT